MLGRGATASGAQVPAMGGTDAEAKAQKRPGAWHPGTEIETNSPSPGDVYVFHYPDDHKERSGYFSHTGLVWAVEKQADGTQIWWTIDGGQGTAGTYTSAVDEHGKVTYTSTQKGAERILKRRRVYDPVTKRMKGGENDDKDDRVLRGWVDIDQLVTAPPGYGYGYADDPLNTGAFEPSVPPVRPGPVRTTVIQPR